ncbi:MAG: D-glycero-beta-D-manno-heptose 1-phosphate adenylyltransferase [Elusimicrobiota bacterium]
MTEKKIKSPQALKIILSRLQKQGRKVVFTNGCFDLLHSGHVCLLEKAKSFGDCLVVAINTDSSVRRLKGKLRPIIPCRERARLVAALAVVDYVVAFSQSTPAQLIIRLKPDILVKGGDYRVSQVVGRESMESWGGKVVVVPLLKGYSTTSLVEKICRQKHIG